MLNGEELIMMYPTLLVLFVAFVAVSARDEDEAYVSRYFMNIHFIFILFYDAKIYHNF